LKILKFELTQGP